MAAVKFAIPPAARSFSIFPRFPVEIRQKIWEAAIYEPGMHFLRLESDTPRLLTGDDAGDGDEEDELTEAWEARLVPLYPTPKADISYYVALNQLLAKLSVTCADAETVVRRLLRQPGALKLDGGRVVSLASSPDVVCLEYLPADISRSGCRLPAGMACPDLRLVRHAAVRYCHQWGPAASAAPCATCGRVHDRDDKVRPVHLYQFLARHLPALETFYLVDYLIVRKPGGGGQGGSFSSGGRTYYEADRDAWAVKSDVFDTLAWLEDSFARYATTSKLSQHPAPRSVRFGVLACEWATPAEPAPTPRKGNKRAFAMVEGPHVEGPAVQASPFVGSASVGSLFGGTPFVFGQGGRFEFTFRVAASG